MHRVVAPAGRVVYHGRMVKEVTRTVLATLCAVMLAPVAAAAFHESGVASCAGCHVMHGSVDGQFVPATGGGLLLGGTASDTCLRCHAAYGQYTAGEGFGPGGDFYWLTRTWTWSTPGGLLQTSPGFSHGHDVVAPAYGLFGDAVRTIAPGGDFPSRDLGCTSCHDPHGNAQFRLLYGAGAGPAVTGGRYAFAAAAPAARGNGPVTIPGRPDSGDETDSRHTVFGSGTSSWCANCHGLYHEASGSQDFSHPADRTLGSARATQYNRYVSTEQPTAGVQATAFWGLVPYEAATVDLSIVDPSDYTLGPSTADRVMCLSCHRAHASPFRAAGRWDFDVALIADSHPQPTDGGASASDVARKYYSYVFVPTQDSLCHKCHREIPGGGSRLIPARR